MNAISPPAFSWLHRFLRRCGLLLAFYGPAVLLWCSSASVAFARKSRNAAEVGPPQKDYVFCYFLVLMCISLGLMMICRPTFRQVEPDSYKTDD